MKRITAALLILITVLGMTACGNTEKTTTIYVQTQSLRTIGEQVIRSDYTYSPKGTPLTVTTYFNDELYQTASTRISGGVNYMTVVDRDGNESTQSTVTREDERGNVTLVEIYVGTTTISRTTYTYDDQDRMLTAITTTSQGNTAITYAYDENGNMIEQIRDDELTDTYTRSRYTYDARGFVQDEKTYDEEGVCLGGITYAYESDDSGRTATYYDGDGAPTGQVVESKYDANGNLIQEITSVDGEVLQTIVNTYETMEVPVEE